MIQTIKPSWQPSGVNSVRGSGAAPTDLKCVTICWRRYFRKQSRNTAPLLGAVLEAEPKVSPSSLLTARRDGLRPLGDEKHQPRVLGQ
jgi:hypothetical protein